MPQVLERRKRTRNRMAALETFRVAPADLPDRLESAALVDISDAGMGVRTEACYPVGVTVFVKSGAAASRARVAWSLLRDDGLYHTGLSFADLGYDNPFLHTNGAHQLSDSFVDYYEFMQLSPAADAETVHRVYRMLAQRYHPDNKESGNEELFKRLVKAYRVLSDPEQRAGYDVEHGLARRLRWRIFDQPNAAAGVEAERRKRHGVLSLLYAKRLAQPEQPAMSLHELEDLLNCPREHLQFTLWYLKENAWITRTDNGRYSITAKGVDQAEQAGAPSPDSTRLLAGR